MLDARFVTRLEALRLVARRRFAGRALGERPSPHKGMNLEFADHRAYQPGDDPRYIDWNVMSRLDWPVVKLFIREEDLNLVLFIDCSESMTFGRPQKLDYAKRVAASLAYVGLVGYDRVTLVAVEEHDRRRSTPPMRGRGSVAQALSFLESLNAHGRLLFSRRIAEFVLRNETQPGLAVLISDFMDECGYAEGLEALRYRGFDAVAFQVLSDQEITPPERGYYRLIDSETGQALDVGLDGHAATIYRQHLMSILEGFESFCLKRGIDYVRASTSVPFEALVLRYLRQGGILK